jgi:hypothetical protein
MPDLDPTHLVTPEARLAFPALFEPKPVQQGSDKLKFQATILLPPGTDLAPFKRAMAAAARNQWGDKIPKGLKNWGPRSCEEREHLEGFDEGWFFFSVKSNPDRRPAVVDQALRDILDPNKVYGGCWCKFHINAYAYDRPDGKGITFGLNGVQLIRDDTRFDGRVDSTSLFTPVAGFADNSGSDKPSASEIDDLFG